MVPISEIFADVASSDHYFFSILNKGLKCCHIYYNREMTEAVEGHLTNYEETFLLKGSEALQGHTEECRY